MMSPFRAVLHIIDTGSHSAPEPLLFLLHCVNKLHFRECLETTSGPRTQRPGTGKTRTGVQDQEVLQSSGWPKSGCPKRGLLSGRKCPPRNEGVQMKATSGWTPKAAVCLVRQKTRLDPMDWIWAESNKSVKSMEGKLNQSLSRCHQSIRKF